MSLSPSTPDHNSGSNHREREQVAKLARLAKTTELFMRADELASPSVLGGDTDDIASVVEAMMANLSPRDAFNVIAMAADVAERRSIALRKAIAAKSPDDFEIDRNDWLDAQHSDLT